MSNAQVAGEDVTGSGLPPDSGVNLKERDPHRMNQHLRLVFSDIFAEPEPGTFSFDKVWVLSFQIFTASKLWCYRILSFLCAIPAAICWGCGFGCLAFSQIWCYIPCIRACKTQTLCCKEVFVIIMNTFIGPIFGACGKVFSNIRIRHAKDGEMLEEFRNEIQGNGVGFESVKLT